jgi:ATP-dependent Clp protease adaptor protein ClpS
VASPKRRLDRGPVLAEERVRPKKPPLYRVVMLNDDYTPMEFVVWVLQIVFHKGTEEATRLMLDVHTKGKGVCGVYSLDVARTKAQQAGNLARRHEHPLRCELEVMESE